MSNLIILLLSLFLVVPSPAHGVESTPSAETIQKSLQDRIKRAINENINGNKPTIQRLKAFFGSVVTISGETITIQRHNSDVLMTYQVTVNKDTKIVKARSSNLTIENISVGDNVIAMGNTSDDQTMVVQRLIIKGEPETIQKTVFQANVLEVNTAKKTITFAQSDTSTSDTLGRSIQFFDGNLKPIKTVNGLPSLAILIRHVDTDDDTDVITRGIFPFLASPSATLR